MGFSLSMPEAAECHLRISHKGRARSLDDEELVGVQSEPFLELGELHRLSGS